LLRFIEENIQKREPFYMQASVVFDAEKMLTESDVQAIVVALEPILN